MFVLYCESDRIVPLIYGPEYVSAAWTQKILAVTVLISFIHNLAADIMVSMKKEKLLLAFYIVGLVSNLALCAVLIPGSPLMGTVLAIVLTKALVGSMTVAYCQLRLGLIPIWPVVRLCLAVGAGMVLYFPAKEILPREAAELIAIAPVLVFSPILEAQAALRADWESSSFLAGQHLPCPPQGGDSTPWSYESYKTPRLGLWGSVIS